MATRPTTSCAALVSRSSIPRCGQRRSFSTGLAAVSSWPREILVRFATKQRGSGRAIAAWASEPWSPANRRARRPFSVGRARYQEQDCGSSLRTAGAGGPPTLPVQSTANLISPGEPSSAKPPGATCQAFRVTAEIYVPREWLDSYSVAGLIPMASEDGKLPSIGYAMTSKISAFCADFMTGIGRMGSPGHCGERRDD